MHYRYKTRGVCAMFIDFDIDENEVVTNAAFTGGCDGNLRALSKLTSGMKADMIESLLKGNPCGYKSTSCADQFAIAVREAAEQMKAQKA